MIPSELYHKSVATENLETAGLKLANFPRCGNFNDRKACLSSVHSCLRPVLDYGSPAEKREARKLLASESLEEARLDWDEFPEQHSLKDRKACLGRVQTCLRPVWDYGSPSEKKEADKLLASKSLEDARLAWEEFPEQHSLKDRKACLGRVQTCLGFVWGNGSPSEQSEADKLQASKSLEDARLAWEEFPEQHSLKDRKACLGRVETYLRSVLDYGSLAEKIEADELLQNVNQELTKL